MALEVKRIVESLIENRSFCDYSLSFLCLIVFLNLALILPRKEDKEYLPVLSLRSCIYLLGSMPVSLVMSFCKGDSLSRNLKGDLLPREFKSEC